MIKLFPLIFLVGCMHYGLFKKEYITLSESPCVDGTILNIDQAGCESFYWGTDREGEILKIRCVYSPKESWWTMSTFYAVPLNYELFNVNWRLHCTDNYVNMYNVPVPVQLDANSENP